MLAEVVHTFVLQAHAVQHAHRRLSHAGVVVALTRLQRRTFHDDAAQLFQGHEVLKLQPIAESARGCHHGVLQTECTYIYI